jgi:tetratricopeptide (TPR) repeat protein
MSYALSHRFRVEAAGTSVVPPLTQGMEAAAGYYRAGDYPEAERCCLDLIKRDSRHFDALHLLGVVCLDRSQLADAVGYLTRAARERADDASVHYHLGTALLGLKLYRQAEPALRRALELRSGDLGTLNNLGNALAGMRQHQGAIECYRHVLAIFPGHAPAHYNLGRSLAALDRLEDAVASFRIALQATSAEPDRLVDIYSGLGDALVELGQYDDAHATCHAVFAIKPEIANWNESLILLLRGQFSDGWRKYEGRWHVADHDRPRGDARIPDLSEVAGKRVLLTCEQGLGDMIQFARYAPLLARQGAHVCLQTYPRLKALMQTLNGVDTVIADGEREPACDIVTPLLSLPLVFGTQVDSIPAEVPYLSAPAARLPAWERRLGQRTGPRIGLAWWGLQHMPKRSLPIEQLLPLLSLDGLEIHSLQKEVPPEQRAWLAAHPLLFDQSEHQNDFADAAALISLLDLVVTIDTSVAHLAGAMGKQVWIMLPYSADWRWLLGRSDSPWYPTARLFRQQRRGDWDGVVTEVTRALSQILRSGERV